MTSISNPVVSVVLGSYNRRHFLSAALESVRQNGMDFPYEIIVVDGGSTDGTLQYLASQKDVITIIQHNRGAWLGKPIKRRSWGYFMNLAFRAASGKYICMLSDDGLVIPGAIQNGLKLFEEKLLTIENVGAVAFYWREWPREVNYKVGVTFGNNIFVNHGLFLKSALEEVGFIDADHYLFYHADGDLVLRMKLKGFSCIDSPSSFVEHCLHTNILLRMSNSNSRDWDVYQKSWGHLGQPESDWLKASFVDPNKTIDRFWKSKKYLIMFVAGLKSLKRMLIPNPIKAFNDDLK